MPLTAFQREVARVLAAHRSPDSHIAGGAAINRGEASLRYSEDLDVFHDAAESVAICADIDANALREQGYTVTWLLRQIGFIRAEVSYKENRLRLDWATDSAFRFFPVQPDLEFGYCLHPADLAVNKVLALAGRCEVRDFLDILSIDTSQLSLAALMWAACGKDPGYTPSLLLDMTNRHVHFQETDLQGERLARPVDLRELKQQWLLARARAERLFAQLPAQELGCLYLGPENNPVTPEPDSPTFAQLVRHFGSVRGAWPKIS